MLTHFDEQGNAIMVDVSDKENTNRSATARGTIYINKEIYDAITNNKIQKGDVLNVARIAGIMATKRTSELIPMCHPLMISKCTIDFEIDSNNYSVTAFCTVKLCGKTGVEMEALTGANIALLTIYDMCKALDKSMKIGEIYLVEKQGGKNGHYTH